MSRLVVVGSSNTDLVVQVPAIPAPGETVLGDAVRVIPGGKGANQAVAAARLGAQVCFIGCIGTDSFGESAIANLAQEGIDTRYVVRTAEHPSGVALIAVSPQGENAIVVAPGANMHLRPEHVEQAEP
ncbi:MAG: PfkB family carbohydrate kinase, partial [Fimbriimonadales bacterium]|nr:PfkB family carbohydrate kinase [Fimbriimonadales bacterium]